jgi:type IV pilus assembly protein PilY1
MRVWYLLMLAVSPVFGEACDDVAPFLPSVESEGVRFVVEAGGSVRALDAASGVERWQAQSLAIGEIWSVPTIARVRFGGISRTVLVVSGGYSEEPGAGNRLFMLDAGTGSLLWVASHPRMTHAIPARAAVVDTDADSLADRIYVADLGGQLWRFDIWDDAISGGVLADLGPRRFFQAPDVSFAGDFVNLAFGSGDRRAPTATGTLERFYSIRDHRPFGKMTQAEYDSLMPIVDADLSAQGTALGWAFDLRPGEKVLAEAITANGTILFTTYTPTSSCVTDGAASVYALQLETGTAALPFGADGMPLRLNTAGIPGDVTIAIDEITRRGSCWVGTERLPVCVPMPRLIRTFWQRGR